MNKKLLAIIGAIVLVVVILVSASVGTYNSIVELEATVTEKKSEISTQLQRRNDLIPNLVNTVKGYAAHESEVYTAIADARSKLAGASTFDEMGSASSELSSALSRLLAVVENYPDLESNTNFMALQDELAGTENRLAQARNMYNEAAKNFNTKIKKFPGNIIAGIFGFEKVEFFEAQEGAEDAPEVGF